MFLSSTFREHMMLLIFFCYIILLFNIMPPKKPWETRSNVEIYTANPQTAANISEIIQSNPTVKE